MDSTLTDEDITYLRRKHTIVFAFDDGDRERQYQRAIREADIATQRFLGDHPNWAALGLDVLLCNYYGYSDKNWKTIEDLRAAFDTDTGHDEEDRALGRAWLSLTPYRVWYIYNQALEWGLDTLRDIAFDIAREKDDGAAAGRALQDEFNRLVRAWEKEYEQQEQSA